MKHTPGPWHRNIKPASRYPTIFAGRNTHIAAISTKSGLSENQLEANLNLMVAAPELLEALKALWKQAVQSDVNSPANEWGMEAIEAAYAAIEKAEGKS